LTELDKGDSERAVAGSDPEPSGATGEAALVQSVRVEFSGPLPHPQLLAQYNEAVPNGADRIVKLTENQARHRQAIESRGQMFTFALAVIALVGGILLIALGNRVEGLVPLLAAIAGLGGLFVYREIQSHKGEKALLED
jgi:uncharacterized membrane protein